MPDIQYRTLLSEIKSLNLPDQLRLMEEMATLIRQKISECKTRSILELRGKGKEIWKGLDVKKYIDEERSTWNG